MSTVKFTVATVVKLNLLGDQKIYYSDREGHGFFCAICRNKLGFNTFRQTNRTSGKFSICRFKMFPGRRMLLVLYGFYINGSP